MTIAARPAAPADLISNIEHIAFDTDAGVGTLANIGLLVLQTDQTIEDEFRLALPDGVALYGARLPSPVEITPDNLRRMEADIPGAVRLLPDVAFGAIGFGCTSGALVIGEAAVAERVREVMPGVKVTDPVTAAVAAFSALGRKRVALLTPYIATINHSLRAAFIERGLEIPVMGSFNEADDNRVARITPDSIERAIMEVGASDACEAVFISCTSLRVARIAEKVEAKLGKPVTSSNHAMAWHLLRLAGYTQTIDGLGALYRTQIGEAGRAG
ncbi:MAG: aspartate/glutamate racemase family protein [Pigmentiphaga sp.]|nr:aspartate/glutamate racemase family protein [Pigmentiphaga sp.]HRP78201.1 aspartate/glutamate racemase family protein [Aquamicrobium sp.]